MKTNENIGGNEAPIFAAFANDLSLDELKELLAQYADLCVLDDTGKSIWEALLRSQHAIPLLRFVLGQESSDPVESAQTRRLNVLFSDNQYNLPLRLLSTMLANGEDVNKVLSLSKMLIRHRESFSVSVLYEMAVLFSDVFESSTSKQHVYGIFSVFVGRSLGYDYSELSEDLAIGYADQYLQHLRGRGSKHPSRLLRFSAKDAERYLAIQILLLCISYVHSRAVEKNAENNERSRELENVIVALAEAFITRQEFYLINRMFQYNDTIRKTLYRNIAQRVIANLAKKDSPDLSLLEIGQSFHIMLMSIAMTNVNRYLVVIDNLGEGANPSEPMPSDSAPSDRAQSAQSRIKPTVYSIKGAGSLVSFIVSRLQLSFEECDVNESAELLAYYAQMTGVSSGGGVAVVRSSPEFLMGARKYPYGAFSGDPYQVVMKRILGRPLTKDIRNENKAFLLKYRLVEICSVIWREPSLEFFSHAAKRANFFVASRFDLHYLLESIDVGDVLMKLPPMDSEHEDYIRGIEEMYESELMSYQLAQSIEARNRQVLICMLGNIALGLLEIEDGLKRFLAFFSAKKAAKVIESRLLSLQPFERFVYTYARNYIQYYFAPEFVFQDVNKLMCDLFLLMPEEGVHAELAGFFKKMIADLSIFGILWGIEFEHEAIILAMHSSYSEVVKIGEDLAEYLFVSELLRIKELQSDGNARKIDRSVFRSNVNEISRLIVRPGGVRYVAGEAEMRFFSAQNRGEEASSGESSSEACSEGSSSSGCESGDSSFSI